jgi:hypothetical protein
LLVFHIFTGNLVSASLKTVFAQLYNMHLGEMINEAVATIQGNEEARKGIAQRLFPLRSLDLSSLGSEEFLEKSFFSAVKPAVLEGKIAGVDSGFVGKSLHSVEIVLVRAVGVVFGFENGALKESHYFPSFFDFPKPHLANSCLDSDELNCSRGLLRLQEETRVAAEVIGKFSPDFCFLDGSIVPQYADKPRKDSEAMDFYHKTIKGFERLFETAEEKACCLVACIEDSRGHRLREILQKEVLSKKPLEKPERLSGLLDSVLFDHLLSRGERTTAFKYSPSVRDHPILVEFGKRWSENIFAFYLKPAELDRPLRVEFFGNGKVSEMASEIASVVYSLSSLHREYAFPSVLVEADLRARLKPQEIDLVFNKILDKLSKRVRLKLRRESRPF